MHFYEPFAILPAMHDSVLKKKIKNVFAQCTLLECCRFGLIPSMLLLSIAFWNRKHTRNAHFTIVRMMLNFGVLGLKAHQNVNDIQPFSLSILHRNLFAFTLTAFLAAIDFQCIS